MRHLSFLCLFVFFAISCAKEEAAPPLPKEKMIDVLVDIHVVEAASQPLVLNLKDSMMNVYYDQICTIHSISREDLDASIMHLKAHPKQMMDVYQVVMDRVAKESANQKK